ncbi:MAG: M24 family metallopeptidase [Gaiellaceae bacterium]
MARGLAPARLLAAQRAALEIAGALVQMVHAGLTERELAARAAELARQRGATGFWAPVAVGAGAGALVCHPEFPPTDRAVADPDLVWFDITPDFGGWPGDATRSVVIGTDGVRERVLADARRIERAIVAAIRPGMPANELFGVARGLLDADGYELLDLCGNIGHDLGRGAVVTGSIDPRNETPMWGCWAIEPHLGLDGIGAKIEDLVWISEEGVHVLA